MDAQLATRFVPKKQSQWLRTKKDLNIRCLTKVNASGVISVLRFVRLKQKDRIIENGWQVTIPGSFTP